MKGKVLPRLVLFAILLTVAIYTAIRFHSVLSVHNLESWVGQFGIRGPLVFMAIYSVAPSLFLPGSVFALAGGALFGPLWGTIYGLTAATAGATGAFFIARYLASDWIAEKTGGRLKDIIDGVNREGWRFVAFVRLVPLFPFNLLNYALGLTKINIRQYIVTSFFCMAPGAFVYTYLGYTGREVVGGGEGLLTKGVLALGFLAALVLLPGLVKRLPITGRKRNEQTQLNSLTTDELHRQQSVGHSIFILDVRDEKEYFGPLGHIAGSTLIPVKHLPSRLIELRTYRDKPMAVI